MSLIIFTIIVLVVIGAVSAVILYFTAQKFKVYEDPHIDQIAEILPGANCGGCGFAGCRALAEALVKSEDGAGLFCPVGGNETMQKAAVVLGRTAQAKTPLVAVVRCNGIPEARPRLNKYDGAQSCALVHSLYCGETGCVFGCVGCGDCVKACNFGAISINPDTHIAEVDADKCTACGACVKACPKNIIELRNKIAKNRKIYVSCVNKDKGALARKACKNACIGCGKCQKVCAFGAISIVDNLAYIDYRLCRLCRKCVDECPTKAIHEVNFPPKKPAVEKTPAVEVQSTNP